MSDDSLLCEDCGLDELLPLVKEEFDVESELPSECSSEDESELPSECPSEDEEEELLMEELLEDETGPSEWPAEFEEDEELLTDDLLDSENSSEDELDEELSGMEMNSYFY
ncbi:MAG: hypothetical protein WAW39_18185 [Prosthecobacter sp.]|uniref:hypothetical protein n=1 Tax=Prosthecobacter sp. TaxID=1965333 RepID=UPI003BAFBCA3